MSAYVQAHLPELELTAWASDYAYRCKLQRYTAEGPLSDAQYDEAQRQRDTHCLLFYHQYQGIPVEAAFWQLDLEGVWVSFGRNEGIISLMAGWHELLPEGETIEPLALEQAMELAAAQHPGEQLTLLDAQLCYFNGRAPGPGGRALPPAMEADQRPLCGLRQLLGRPGVQPAFPRSGAGGVPCAAGARGRGGRLAATHSGPKGRKRGRNPPQLSQETHRREIRHGPRPTGF